MKKPKEIFRDLYKWYVGKRNTHQEKVKNSDPDVIPFVRGKRKPINIPDSYSDTKWLRKLKDKSWKNRCKKRKQFIKHEKSNKERLLLKDGSKVLQKLKYKYRDMQWHELESDNYGWLLEEETRMDVKWLEYYAQQGIFEIKYKTITWKFLDFGIEKEKSRKIPQYVRLVKK